MLLVLLILAFASATKWHQLETYRFEDYVAEYNLAYAPNEVRMRQSLFEARLREIRQHNSDPTQTWKAGVNQFTDRTEGELKAMLGGRRVADHMRRTPVEAKKYDPEYIKAAGNIPIDWRTQGVITPVKDQGRCGSCWSFAAAETLESYHAIATGSLAILSQQQILDCTPNPKHCGGTGGCGGATAELAYGQIAVNGGLASEWTYPYMSYFGDAGMCNSTRMKAVASISTYVNLPINEYAPVVAHLLEDGPLAVSVDASVWFKYETGVFNSCNQTNPDLDHAVQLVGMGVDPQSGKYWLVRNSWTTAWGENGYIRLYRSEDTVCGIDLTPGDGDGCDNGPATETVCGTCGILYDALYPVIKGH